MDHQNLVLRERACSLLGLSITQIILGCISILTTFGRLFIGVFLFPVHLALGLLDLVLGILLLATGSYGTSLSQRARRIPGGSSSFRVLAILNIILSVIDSLYILLYIILLILLWSDPVRALKILAGMGLSATEDDEHEKSAAHEIFVPLVARIVSLPLVFVLLTTVAELLIATIAAKISREIAAGTAVNMERGGGVTYTVQPSAPPAYVEQPLLGTYEKSPPKYI